MQVNSHRTFAFFASPNLCLRCEVIRDKDFPRLLWETRSIFNFSTKHYRRCEMLTRIACKSPYRRRSFLSHVSYKTCYPRHYYMMSPNLVIPCLLWAILETRFKHESTIWVHMRDVAWEHASTVWVVKGDAIWEHISLRENHIFVMGTDGLLLTGIAPVTVIGLPIAHICNEHLATPVTNSSNQ